MKILILTDNLKLTSGGSKVLHNYLSTIKNEKLLDVKKIDILCFEPLSDKDSVYGYEKIKKLGYKVYFLPVKLSYKKLSFLKNYFIVRNYMKNIFKRTKYDVVHNNIDWHGSLFLKLASKYKVEKRCAIFHVAGRTDSLYKRIHKFFVSKSAKYATKIGAVSDVVKNELKIKNAVILSNPNISKEFKFSKKLRNNLLNEFKILKNTKVFGSICRLANEKNIIFFLECYKEVANKNNKFILVGDGTEREKIEKYIKENNLIKNVILTGSVNDAYKYYNIIDIFCITSISEGLPLTLIEAQTNGCFCLSSDKVPTSAQVLKESVKYIPLEKSIWVDELRIANNNIKRAEAFYKLKNSKYTLKNATKELIEFYNSK